ncbi:MAG TPA: hypothetical protein ENK47_05490 [Euryarchaeota archaeon]|nr:MAG: hypothetical protein B6U90_05180 [Thermoplasmatales archaeon ex4484_6]RLF69394.1 MAG: hypothetical protein DRN57_00805 [Thermoplasmata archaeon]HHD16144.1 hypothetical protein [Euryarchaeota archaeon]
MAGGFIGDIPVPGTDPYSDVLELERSYAPRERVICPVCGSPHQTCFNKVLSLGSDGSVISGDLSIKSILVTRCLSCGHTAPSRFFFIREM